MNASRPVPVDPALPHLAMLVQAGAMARCLQPLLGAGASLRQCEIERVKYRPGRNCVVGYRLQADTPAGPRESRISVSMYDAAEAVQRHARAAGEGGAGSMSFLPEIDALARVFPADRKLPQLPELSDASVLTSRCLPGLVSNRWGSAWRVRASSHAVLGYFPEHTCTVVLHAEIENGAASHAQHWRVFGKARYDDAGETTHRVMQALWSSEAHRAGLVGYARPLVYEADRRLHWQEGVQAPTLHARLATGPIGKAALHRVATAVAALHRSGLVAERQVDRVALVAALDRAESVVGRALPGLAGELRSLIRDLCRRSADLDVSLRGTLHGDLHSKNVLLGTDRATLIDLDRLSGGLVLSEVGGLLAELAARDCAAGRGVDDAALAAFVEAYRRASGWTIAPDDLAWHFATALVVERAARAVTSLKPGWPRWVPTLIGTARRALSGNAATAAVRAACPMDPPCIPS